MSEALYRDEKDPGAWCENWVYRFFTTKEPGRGTAFEIYLPATEETKDTATRTAALDSVRGSETILVVEDEENVRNLTVLALTRMASKIREILDQD